VPVLPKSARAAAILQLIVAVTVLAVWVLWAGWGRFPFSLVFSSICFSPAFLACAFAAFELSQGRMYGWVTGLLGNGVATITLLVFGGATAILPLAVVIYFLVPAVREYYTHDYYS
jgi:hypothetical protein